MALIPNVLYWDVHCIINRGRLMSEERNRKLCKVVYFDEDSVTDYVQIVSGGELEKTAELLKESNKGIEAGATAKASFGTVMAALLGLKVSAETTVDAEVNFSANKMVKNIVKNTILTDFLEIVRKDSSNISSFYGYDITAPKESMTYVALISPYLSMLKGGVGIPAGEFNIAIEKLDNTIKSAKGYYEFLGEKKGQRVIFRFNINAFRNNYKAPDLMKMDISIYAIRVGKSSVSKLNFNNEFDIDSIGAKDNPEYDGDLHKKEPEDTEMLDVYDVLLAGVESYD